MELFHGSPSDMTGRSSREIRCYDFLDRRGISFDRTDHPDQPATSMEVCEQVGRQREAERKARKEGYEKYYDKGIKDSDQGCPG